MNISKLYDKIQAKEALNYEEIKNNQNALFIEACKNGHTETAKWLWGLSMSEGNTPINIHANNE